MSRPRWLRVIRWFSPYPVRFWKVKRDTRIRRSLALWVAAGNIRRMK